MIDKKTRIKNNNKGLGANLQSKKFSNQQRAIRKKMKKHSSKP